MKISHVPCWYVVYTHDHHSQLITEKLVQVKKLIADLFHFEILNLMGTSPIELELPRSET